MHSRIFCVSENPSKEKWEDGFILDESEIRETIGADYVVDSNCFEDDINWLSSIYGKDVIINVNNENNIATISVENFIPVLEKRRVEAIEKIRGLVSKPADKVDLYDVSKTANPFWEMYFIAENCVENDFSFLNFLYRWKEEGVEEVYIYKIFDYHV